MNPDTNKFEKLTISLKDAHPDKEVDLLQQAAGGVLFRPNGEPVPKHWSIFQIDEEVVIKDYTFRIAYINETTLILEPVNPVILPPNNVELKANK